MTKTWATGSGYLVVPATNWSAAVDATRAALATGGPLADVRAFDPWRTTDGAAFPAGADVPAILKQIGFTLDPPSSDPAVILVDYDDEVAGVTEVLDVLAPHIAAGVITWEFSDGTHCKDRFGNGTREEIPGRVVHADELIGWIIDDLPDGTGLARTGITGGSTVSIDWRRALTDRRYHRTLLSLAAQSARKSLEDRVTSLRSDATHGTGR